MGMLWEFGIPTRGNPVGMEWEWEIKFTSHGNSAYFEDRRDG